LDLAEQFKEYQNETIVVLEKLRENQIKIRQKLDSYKKIKSL